MHIITIASVFAVLLKVLHDTRKTNRRLLFLTNQAAQFLRPRVVILIGNEIARRLQMNDSQQLVATLAQVDAKGFPVTSPQQYDAPPSWSIDNPSIATITPSADGTSCTVVAVAPGTAN